VIELFDRSSQGPVYIEDFVQTYRLRPEEKYGKASYRNNVTVLGMENSHDDIAEFIRCLFFSTLIGNDDMHVKNWLLIYYDKKEPPVAQSRDNRHCRYTHRKTGNCRRMLR